MHKFPLTAFYTLLLATLSARKQPKRRIVKIARLKKYSLNKPGFSEKLSDFDKFLDFDPSEITKLQADLGIDLDSYVNRFGLGYRNSQAK